MSEKFHPVIGIDLGTTYSAVAAYNKYEEQTEILPNHESVDGEGRTRPETTPSVIALDPQTNRVIVGWPAKRSIGTAAQTVIEIKREMGEMFREDTLDKFNARGIFRARQEGAGGDEGDPVKVQLANEWYLPQEISAFTLMKMKQAAEAELGEPIRDAVITVPAYFTEKQKKATEEAAFLAGLYPRQLIPEPTAAAICYGVDRLEASRKVYLVYDLGGGTFDVSIISVEESQIDVLATSGDPRLGGGDFDDAIVKWSVEQLKQRNQLDASGDATKLARIKAHAEQAKRDLSTFNTVTMTFLDVWPEAPSLELSREEFVRLIDPLLNKSLSCVDAALNQAKSKRGLERDDVDAILLVGGSSKIPRVKEMLLEYFQQDESFVSSGLNPDEVVARGAAMVALKFVPSEGEFNIAKRPDNTLVNPEMDEGPQVFLITEHSLGIGIQNNLVSRIIDMGTNIPASRRQSGYTNGGPVEHLDVAVYQGEGEYQYENTLIGTLKIGPMEPKPENTHQFDVTFSLDDNGLLSMTVHHLNEGKNYQGTFEQRTGVGGVDALTVRRTKLEGMYAGAHTAASNRAVRAPAGPVSPASASAPGAPAATAPPAAPAAVAVTAAAVAPAAATIPSPPGQPGLPGPTGSRAVGVDSTSAREPATSSNGASSTLAGGADGVIEPTAAIPEEFKSLVRRSQKLLLNGAAPRLLDAFNRFTSLLNAGEGGEALEEAGDHLADVYHDSR
jgi:molecular chaperone DnaK (HSP70)